MRKQKKPVIWEKVSIHGLADKGKGVGRNEEGMVVFVEETAPGDVVDVRVTKKKDYAEGRPINFHSYSADRTTPFCTHFNICGGCKLQHMTYESQLLYKDKLVKDALQRIGKVDVGEYLPIIGAQEQKYYRNKLEFTFANKQWITQEMMDRGDSNLRDVLGFHRPGAFDKMVHVDECFLMPEPMNALRNFMHALAIEQKLEFYDVRNHEGYLRNVMMRITTLGQILVVMVFKYEDKSRREAYLNGILRKFPEVTSLQYCINEGVNDSLWGREITCFDGKPYIEEALGHVTYRIAPHSFFQTSTKQAVRLFDTVVDFAGLTGQENVYDLYTGVGSIGLYVAKDCKQVVGIEEIPEAIVDAQQNAERNGILNTKFYAGDVKNILTDEFAAQHGKPDVLITDPPRTGMHEKVVEMLLKLEAPKIVYVSCNPSTQARDLAWLSPKYEVIKSQAVDMFPFTHHIENVVLLALRAQV
ncbi:MAG: 23S rRNA (uracil(1939)-C(5))-methyltransferase RlmD [Saprospiraceae bacterium]